MSLRIGIAGISGRMGMLLAEEVVAAGARLAAGLGRTRPAAWAQDMAFCTDIAKLAGQVDLVIDFTHASLVQRHAQAIAASGTAWVLGTTGLSGDDAAAVAAAARMVPLMAAPNYAPGVTLMLALAEQMAASLPSTQYDAEIMEMHHRQKVDAPSGTALGLGEAVAAGRGVDLAEMRCSGRDGHTGPRRPGAIGFAALRGGQVVGEHSLIFAGASEHITLSHRAFDRRVFATGAVRAALWLHGRPPGTYTMRDVLGIVGRAEGPLRTPE